MNAANRETQLWYWLLYKEGLATSRAKSLLETWRTQGTTLEAALAALPESAIPLVDYFARILNEAGVPAQTGEFGAHMLVEIHNDGPVTIALDA